MDALERGYLDNFETAFDAIAEELGCIRRALTCLVAELQHPKPEPEKKPAVDNLTLAMSISAMDVSTRAINILIDNKCKTIGDVVLLSRKNLLATRGCGKLTLHEIEAALAKSNLKLSQ